MFELSLHAPLGFESTSWMTLETGPFNKAGLRVDVYCFTAELKK